MPLNDTHNCQAQLPGKQPFLLHYRIDKNSVHHRSSLYYFCIPLLLLMAWFVYRAANAPFSDFAGYYFGSIELLHGNYHTAYDTPLLNLAIEQQGYTDVFVSYTPFPPFTALVMAPFILLPPAVSKIVFTSLSALLFVFTLVRAVKFFSLPVWVLLAVPLVFCIPIRNNIFFGQSYLLLTVLLLEGYMAYKKEKRLAAALLWSVAILFKIFPVCILFFLLVKKQYRMVGYCVGACASLGLLSVWCTGFDVWRFYVFTIMPRLNNGELNDGFTYTFQSAFMLLKNLLVYDPVLNPRGLYANMHLLLIAIACYKAIILAGCVGLTLQKKTSDLMAFGVWIIASLLLSPNGSTYSLILLVIPLLAFTKWEIVLLFLICWMPVQYFVNWPVLLQYPRLYLLLLLFIMITQTQFSFRAALVFCALLLLSDAHRFFHVFDKSSDWFNKPTPLIFNFVIKQDQLVYYYWDGKGAHEVLTGYAVQTATTKDLRLNNNQLFYKGKQLTNTSDWKKQPLLINGKYILYLSDKNRGVGFYTLRFIIP